MSFDTVMNYVDCDLDASVTLPQWRRMRAATHPRRRYALRRLRQAPARPQAGV